MLRFSFKRSAQLLRLFRRLIDHRAPVDDINEPARQRRAVSARDEPQRHHHRLAEAGRDVDGVRRVALCEVFLQQSTLPAKRFTASEGDEASDRIK